MGQYEILEVKYLSQEQKLEVKLYDNESGKTLFAELFPSDIAGARIVTDLNQNKE